MDADEIRAVLQRALDRKTTLNQWRLLSALICGHRGAYNLQQVTKLKKHRLDEIAHDVQLLLRNTGYNTNTNTRRSTAHDVQTPPQRLIGYLFRSLDRPPDFTANAQRSMKELYWNAYLKYGKNERAALLAIKDCIDVCVKHDKFSRSNYPVGYLKTLLGVRLKALDTVKKPRSILEMEEFTGKRFRFDHIEYDKTKQWEETNEKL